MFVFFLLVNMTLRWLASFDFVKTDFATLNV